MHFRSKIEIYSPKAGGEAKLKPKLKPSTTVPLAINIDELEKMEMAKNRPLATNTWYDWLIHQIPEPGKKSASNVKDKIMNLP